MSLNTSMPYYRNTSREVKTVKEIIQCEAIKSARLLSRDKVKVKQNTSIGDLNRSKGRVNNSFYDNRQVENTNILHTYLANAFQERKENIHKDSIKKTEENKQREIKYLMRIAALEKETQKLTELVNRLKKDNSKQSANQIQLQEALNQSKIENQLLKKQITHLQNNNSVYKKSEVQRSTSTNTTNSEVIKSKDFIPSYMLALSLVE